MTVLKVMLEFKPSVTPKRAALIKADITRVYRLELERAFVIIEPPVTAEFKRLPKELEGDLS